MELLASINFIFILALGWQMHHRAEAQENFESVSRGDSAFPSVLENKAPIPSFQLECNNDYRKSVQPKVHHLNQDTLKQLDLLSERGVPLEGWRFLAKRGDSYAQLASQVLDPAGGLQDQYYRGLILRHWRNVVGNETLHKTFQTTAQQHFRQYASIVQQGAWPDSDQILLSYLTAARTHHLPDLVVFDAAWDAAGMNVLQSWQSLNHLGADRAVLPTQACFSISSQKAKSVIARDLLGF